MMQEGQQQEIDRIFKQDRAKSFEIDQLKWSLTQLENTLRNREDNLSAQDTRINQLVHNYEEERLKKLALEQQVSVMKQLEDKVSQLNNQIKSLGTEIERINRDLANKMKENDDLRKKIAKLESQLQDQRQLDARAKEIENKYNQALKELEKLQGQLKQKTLDADQLKSQCQQLEAKLKGIMQQLDQTTKKSLSMEQTVKQLQPLKQKQGDSDNKLKQLTTESDRLSSTLNQKYKTEKLQIIQDGREWVIKAKAAAT